jgi:hypothetical protein
MIEKENVMKFHVLAVSAVIITSSFVQAQVKSGSLKKYVKNEQATIANSGQQGQTIGVLGKGTELVIMEETPTMAKVQITAWIAKTELVASRPLRALHIAVKTKAAIDSILADLKIGKEFIELARTKSILANAVKGGDLGYFSKGDFDPKIEAAIEALDINQISGIVETSFGFNIFKRIQ